MEVAFWAPRAAESPLRGGVLGGNRDLWSSVHGPAGLNTPADFPQPTCAGKSGPGIKGEAGLPVTHCKMQPWGLRGRSGAQPSS